MLQETWSTLPRQIVQKINGLLDQAQPNSLKAYQIYKLCKAEKLWDKSYSEFSFLLEGFYQQPPHERSKSQMDQFLNRPMDCSSFESVQLTFRTAEISATEIRDIASWAHHSELRLQYQKTSSVSSIEAFSKTIYDLTHPGYGEKDKDIDFEDFCEAWKDAVDSLYGKKFEKEHQAVLSDLRNLNQALKSQVIQVARPLSTERIYLTQTEIDWVEQAREAVMKHLKMPRYPLSKGPSKERLAELLKWLTLWEIAKSSKAPTVQAQVEKLRNYIHGECEWLLSNCRR